VLIFTKACVEEIAKQGDSYKWERPCCPCGCPKVWGHGYVARIFAAILEAVLLKRYRAAAGLTQEELAERAQAKLDTQRSSG